MKYQLKLIPNIELKYNEETGKFDGTKIYNEFFVKDENGHFRPLYYMLFKDFSDNTPIKRVLDYQEAIIKHYDMFYENYFNSVSNVYWDLNDLYDHYLEFYKWLFGVKYDKRLFWLAFHILHNDLETRENYLLNLFNTLVRWKGHTMKIIIPYEVSEEKIRRYLVSLLQKCDAIGSNSFCHSIEKLINKMTNDVINELIYSFASNISKHNFDLDIVNEYIETLGFRVLEYIISKDVYNMIKNQSGVSELSIFPREITYYNDNYQSYSGFYVYKYFNRVVIRNDSNFEWPVIISEVLESPSFHTNSSSP